MNRQTNTGPLVPRLQKNRLRRAAGAVGAVCALALAIAAPVWFWDGGLIEIEGTRFVQQYLDERGLLQKIFDPNLNDFGTYQARELSYLFDYLDARVFDRFLVAGHVVLVPATGMLASLLIVSIVYSARREYPSLGSTGVLLVLLYLTNYTHVATTGMLYRSAKPLLAPLVVGATLFVIAANRRERADAPGFVGRVAPYLVFLLLCTGSWFDRQGFFLAVIMTALVVVHAWLSGGRRDVAIAAVLAVGTMVLYDVIIAPAVIRRLNGYTPTFEYQRIPLQQLVRDWTPWWRGLVILMQGIAILGGGAPPWMTAVGAGAVVCLAWRLRIGWRIAVLWSLAGAGLLLMFALMVVRHPYVYEYVDHRLWYYPVPLQALILALMVVYLGCFASSLGHRIRFAINVILVAGIVLNINSWTRYRQAQLASEWFPYVFDQSGKLKQALNRRDPRELTNGYRTFYDFCLARYDVQRRQTQPGRGMGAKADHE